MTGRRVWYINNDNTTRTIYAYDEADRVTTIVHRQGAGGPILWSVDYAWNLDNTVAQRVGWVERSETRRRTGPGYGGFRCAQPTLQLLDGKGQSGDPLNRRQGV